MRRLAPLGVLALLAVVTAGCMGGSDDDSSARRAAIGSSTPAAGEASIQAPAFLATPIKVTKWQWSAKTSVTMPIGGTQQTSVPEASGFTITKNIDNASNNIYNALMRGTNVPTLTFKVGTTLTYDLTNVRVQSVEQSGTHNDGNEEVAFVFTRIRMTNQTAPGGLTTVCWDYALRAPC